MKAGPRRARRYDSGSREEKEPPALAEELIRRLGLTSVAVAEAQRRGLLTFPQRQGGACWRFGDRQNGSVRRIDGLPFTVHGKNVKAMAETRGDAWHRLIGMEEILANKRMDVMLVLEGSKDGLTAFHFAALEDCLSVGIAVGLGTGLKLRADDIDKFRGHRVRIFGDADCAGQKAAQRVASALASSASEVQLFDLRGLKCKDGSPVGDLFDLTRMARKDFEAIPELRHLSDLNFRGARVRVIERQAELIALNGLASLSSLADLVTKENQRNTNEDQGWKGKGGKKKSLDSLLELADSLRCFETGTGHRQQFELARHTRAFEKENGSLSTEELRTVHCRWFQNSTALPFDSKEVEAFCGFLQRLKKVRAIPGESGKTLSKAIEAARKHPLPEIPHFPDAPTAMRQIAALHRELQRSTGGAAHFCTAETARTFSGLAHKIEAHRIQRTLENEHLGVLRCVKRGEPRRGGNPTLWLYLLPIAAFE